MKKEPNKDLSDQQEKKLVNIKLYYEYIPPKKLSINLPKKPRRQRRPRKLLSD